jgi:hypothetical protein
VSTLRYPVVELRQYTLRPGQRDVLIGLFDREFVESQEAAGMAIVGQFRDLDDPDRFVWIRGFASMPARATALASFYGGPVWKQHAAAANATMTDSDNVLLLRPATAQAGFPAPTAPRPPASHQATAAPSCLLVTLYYRDRPFDPAFTTFFESEARPLLAARIASRIQDQLADGFLDQASALVSGGFAAGAPGLHTLGYRELLSHLRGEAALEEAIATIALRTRQLAKRQETWFRRVEGVEWFDLEAPEQLAATANTIAARFEP